MKERQNDQIQPQPDSPDDEDQLGVFDGYHSVSFFLFLWESSTENDLRVMLVKRSMACTRMLTARAMRNTALKKDPRRLALCQPKVNF